MSQTLHPTSPVSPTAERNQTALISPKGCSPWILPCLGESGVPWDRSHPPTIISYLKGPHFSYDCTPSLNGGTMVPLESYEDLLLGTGVYSRPDLYRKIKYIRSLLVDSKEQDSQRRFVLSQDTPVVLELNFTPGPSHSLVFDALEIPLTRSVKHSIDPQGRRLLLFRVLLVDAITNMLVQISEWDQDKVDEQVLVPSLVDFQAEHNIIDVCDGKAIVYFTLPCCFLDSTHRTGHYRICIALKLDGHQVGFQTLPGVFGVVHMDKKTLRSDLQYPKDTTFEGSLDQLPHSYSCTARLNSRRNHSDFNSGINGCFEQVFSLALGLDRIPLQDISASENHRSVLFSLLPTESRQLRAAIELEYYHIGRTLTRARHGTEPLQRQYEIAINLIPTPIQRLPVELFALIFSLVPGEQNQKFDILSRTCHRWKKIVSSIWAPLKLATWTSLDEVQAILDSGSGLVSVTIDPFSDAMVRPMGALETEQYAALMFAVSTSTSRWRTLDILSLPDPLQTNNFFEKHDHVIPLMPMEHLRSLNIPIRHDSSRFLDLLLPSISATTSVQLTDMHICSAQAMLYLAQPHFSSVFNFLTSFKCFLPRTDVVIDTLPYFLQLEVLDVSGLHFPTYAANIELPLTGTLHRVSLQGVAISWMNHREFRRLKSCTIISPPASDTIPITSLPLCTELLFDGAHFDVIQKFHVPAIHTLTLRSPQWSKSRGDDQLSHLWGAAVSEGALRPTSLHIYLICSGEHLLQALCFMPELKELILEMDRPTALGSRFFTGFLPRSSRVTWPHKWVGKNENPLQACPSLEVLGLKYRRWFRPGEPNEMPVLVAMAHLDVRDHKVKIWVEKGTADQERIQIDCPYISTPTLCSLGLLRLVDGGQPSSQVVNEALEASLATINPTGIRFNDAETMALLSPSIYSCLFRRLRDFILCVDVDQRVLLEALSHFEQLEEMQLKRFSPSSSQPHLPLLKTLKKMLLDMTSLSWMEGCTFIKLEVLEIGEIETDIGGQFQCVQMPMCKSASLPQSIFSDFLGAFQMPQLRTLHLLSQPSLDRISMGHSGRYATTREGIQKDVWTEGISTSNVTALQSTRNASTYQSKLPYPIGYQHEVLDWDFMDHEFLMTTSGLSFVDFQNRKPPMRCLDLGCGTGAWVLQAAKTWRETEFVGFDVANIQPQLGVANRVRWVHGNFLTQPLPFEDGYFHHVRTTSIAKGVPEDKWGLLFDEIARVMAPGASLELVEEDILFPFIPRTSSSAIDQESRFTRTSSLPIETTFLDPKEQPRHDHALLESLFFGVFNRRFINTRPTKIIPQYLNYQFQQVMCGPYLNFPMPPPPPSKSKRPAPEDASESEEDDNEVLVISNMPWETGSGGAKASKLSVNTTTSISASPRADLSASGYSHGGSDTELHPTPFGPSSKRAKWRTPKTAVSPRTKTSYTYSVPLAETRAVELQVRGLALHFSRAWQHVIGCRDAMWEECQQRKIEGSKEAGLESLWWDTEEAKLPDKEKFNLLMARYEKDMRRRTGLRYAIHKGLGWSTPKDDFRNSRAVMGAHWEVVEEEMDLEREKAAREARLAAANEDEEEDDSANCRQIRAFVGWKL